MEYGNNLHRGEVYYIMPGLGDGREMLSGRPAIIVSADSINRLSTTVEVVYLTTQPKRDMLSHVEIRSTNKLSTALCEQITTVDTDKVGDYMCNISESEMQKIEAAMLISLAMKTDYFGSDNYDKMTKRKIEELENEIRKLTAEKDAAEKNYDRLIDRMLK